MSKTLLVLFVCFLSLLAVFFFIRTQPVRQTVSQVTTLSQKPTNALQTSFAFTPNVLSVTASQSASLSISLNPQGTMPETIQFELAYNPLLLQNITMTPGDFFAQPHVVLDNIDVTTGRISYALQASANDGNRTGAVAVITFFPVNTLLPIETKITFLPKTMVKDGNGQTIPVATSEATITILPLIRSFSASQSASAQPAHH